MGAQSGDLVGFADLHAHLVGHLASGGTLVGDPYDPDNPGEEGITRALTPCEATHGIDFLNPEILHKEAGFPEFHSWPLHTTLAHQQAYIDWVRRAYDGGLRLVCCSAVNNELLADRFGREGYHRKDSSAVNAQLEAMQDMVTFIDGQSGGDGQGWLQIASSAAEARRIIADDKLAVVLAVEVDSLCDWKTPADLPEDLGRARRVIRKELARLRGKGVRHIGPMHLTDNAFGGAAIYNRLFDGLNKFITKYHYTVEHATHTGIEYRLQEDKAGGGALGYVKRLLTYGFGRQSHRSHREVRGGQANQKGLSPYGRILLEEMMRLGMIIDVDHMSQRSADETLKLAEEVNYPVIASHAAFRELALRRKESSIPDKWASEGMQRPETIERIRKLGGVIAPILYQAEVETHCVRIPNDCAGSSKSFAQAYLYAVEKMGRQGVALGSDVNGLANLPGPRFGTRAAPGLIDDDKRQKLVDRRDQLERQDNAVRYGGPLRDYRTYRWERGDKHGYSRQEAWTFQAIALEASGEELARADILDRSRKARRWIINVATGLRAQSLDQLPEPSGSRGRTKVDARIQRAAFHARAGTYPGEIADRKTRRYCEQIAAIWCRFQKMNGENGKLPRSIAGQRDFDINIDGVAHYGLLRDFLDDLRNIGLTDADLTPLFRSAEHFVRMWEKCESQGSAISGGVLITEVDEGGDVATEHVRIRSTGNDPLDMTGWTLEGGGERYAFPRFTLPAHGEVRVWTRPGEDGDHDLFWGRQDPVWGKETAHTAVLRDRTDERSSFVYRRPSEPASVPPPPFRPSTRSPDVEAPVLVKECEGDVDTRVDIHPGDEWQVLATGAIWSGVWFKRRNGPAGWSTVEHDPRFPLHEGDLARPYSLVGRLEGGGYQYIGPLTPRQRHGDQERRRLYLRINNDKPGNGWGAFRCHVRVWKASPSEQGMRGADGANGVPNGPPRLVRPLPRLQRGVPLNKRAMRSSLFRHLKRFFYFLRRLLGVLTP